VGQHVVDRVVAAQHVVREVEQRRIRPHGNPGRLDRRADQRHVAPAGGLHPRTRLRDHLGALLHPDHTTALAHCSAQPRQAQAGAASEIEHHVARTQTEQADRDPPDRLEHHQLEVVEARAPAVLRQRGRAVGPVARMRRRDGRMVRAEVEGQLRGRRRMPAPGACAHEGNSGGTAAPPPDDTPSGTGGHVRGGEAPGRAGRIRRPAWIRRPA